MKTWRHFTLVAIFTIKIAAVLFALLFSVACDNGSTTPVNKPPTANAGTNQTVTLADNLTVTLDGTASSGSITAYAWQCKSYTADQGTVNQAYTKEQVTALIANANTATTTVTPRKAGTYIFTLTLSGSGGTDTADVKVVVEGFEGTVTKTKDVNVTFAPFDVNPTEISMVPIYNNGIWGDETYFQPDDIKFKITFSFQGDNHATVFDYPEDVVTLAKQKELNGGTVRPWPCPLYRQTFLYKEVGETNILGWYEVFIGDFSSGYFDQIRANDNVANPGRFNTNNTLVTALPPPSGSDDSPLTLTLSKEVEETVSELP